MTDKDEARRRYDIGLKAKVLSACDKPGATVAGVARAHGLRANAVHGWRYEARQRQKLTPGTSGKPQAPCGQFVALAKPSATACSEQDIRIEVRRGSTVIAVNWPMSQASRCAAMLSRWLR